MGTCVYLPWKFGTGPHMDTGSNRSVYLHQIQNLLSLLRHGIQTSVLKYTTQQCQHTGRHPIAKLSRTYIATPTI